MPSQFFGLNTGYLGLLASNAAMNTTANNIANVHTEGYSRQAVNQQAANALRVFQKYGCAGAGVETISIERIHDDFYDVKYWDTQSCVGEYEYEQYYMKQIENYVDDKEITPGFTTIFDQMKVALQEVMKNPSSRPTKAQFIGSLESLSEYFNNLYGNLQKLQKDVNAEIKLKVDEINSIASEIASLNKQINIIEMGKGTANELRDRRTLLLDELSKIVDVSTMETPVVDTNHPENDTGATRFMVMIGGGQILVDANEYNGLRCVARPIYDKTNQSDITGLYEVYWDNGRATEDVTSMDAYMSYKLKHQEFDLHNPIMGGALKGLVAMRDGNNNEFFNGVVANDGIGTTTVNGEVHDTVTVNVSHDYLCDLNKCNLSDAGGKLRLGNQFFYYDSWSVTKGASGDYTYTFVLSDETKNKTHVTNDRIGKEATIGNAVDYQGIPYYMKQMNEWVRTFSQHVNDILNGGYDAYGNPGYNMLTGDMPTGGIGEQYDFSLGVRFDRETDVNVTFNEGADATHDQTKGSYYWLNAGNFNVNYAFETDADLLATRKEKSNGADDSSVVKELENMFDDKSQMSFRGCSASEFLECILSDVALNASQANTFTNSYTNISKSIENQRLSISGVDEDEEAVDLVKFQNAYNLASKMIQTLTEVYDRLILQTGV